MVHCTAGANADRVGGAFGYLSNVSARAIHVALHTIGTRTDNSGQLQARKTEATAVALCLRHASGGHQLCIEIDGDHVGDREGIRTIDVGHDELNGVGSTGRVGVKRGGFNACTRIAEIPMPGTRYVQGRVGELN